MGLVSHVVTQRHLESTKADFILLESSTPTRLLAIISEHVVSQILVVLLNSASGGFAVVLEIGNIFAQHDTIVDSLPIVEMEWTHLASHGVARCARVGGLLGPIF